MNNFITHIDLDGVSIACLLMFYKFPIKQIIYKDYEDNIIPYLKSKNNIYITDFSLSKEIYNCLVENNKNFKVFDHHERTSLYKDADNVYYNAQISGTEIFYNWLIEEKNYTEYKGIKQYIKLVSTYDTWKKDSELWSEAKNLQRLFIGLCDFKCKDYHKYFPFILHIVNKFKKNKDIFEFTEKDLLIINKQIDKEEKEFQKAEKILQIRTDYRGKKFGLFRGLSKISNTCHKLLESHEELDYIICINSWDRFKTGKAHIRSREDGFDCRQMEVFDGHTSASAGIFDPEYLNEIWLNNKECFEYK